MLVNGLIIVINQLLGFGKGIPNKKRIPIKVPMKSKKQKAILSLYNFLVNKEDSSYRAIKAEIIRNPRDDNTNIYSFTSSKNDWLTAPVRLIL